MNWFLNLNVKLEKKFLYRSNEYDMLLDQGSSRTTLDEKITKEAWTSNEVDYS